MMHSFFVLSACLLVLFVVIFPRMAYRQARNSGRSHVESLRESIMLQAFLSASAIVDYMAVVHRYS